MQVAILAGGESRRMGRDKALALWRGEPLLAHMIRTAAAAGADSLVISGAPEKYGAFGRSIADQGPGGGPLRGMATVLRAAAGSRVLMLACDLPHVTPAFLRWLGGQSAAGSWTVAVNADGEAEPLCAVYAKELLPYLDAALAGTDYKIARALAAAPQHVLTAAMLAAAGFSAEMFRNCNTPRDLEQGAGAGPGSRGRAGPSGG